MFSCQKEQKELFTILSGKIENSTYNQLKIIDFMSNNLATIALSSTKTFKDTLDIPEGYYYLDAGDQYTFIYLKPEFELNIDVDAKDFDKSLKYSGKGAKENNYLAKKQN
jgi:hypothetical protein